MSALTEKSLVERLHALRRRKSELETELDGVGAEINEIKDKLIEKLTEQGKSKTAAYLGLGWATLTAPKVRASIPEECKEDAFAFIRKNDRADMIKLTVNANSLSSFVGELLDDGKKIPDVIKYALIPDVYCYDENGKRV